MKRLLGSLVVLLASSLGFADSCDMNSVIACGNTCAHLVSVANTLLAPRSFYLIDSHCNSLIGTGEYTCSCHTTESPLSPGYNPPAPPPPLSITLSPSTVVNSTFINAAFVTNPIHD